MKRKNYNLATPELIAKLWEVGAIAHPHKSTSGYLLYKVSVRAQYRDVINPLLTGTKLNAKNAIYSKDVWNALLTYTERRTSYGHLETRIDKQLVDLALPEAKAFAKLHCCAEVKSFRFSDGKVISMCPTHSDRTNHFHHELNSQRFMDVQRRTILCGGAR